MVDPESFQPKTFKRKSLGIFCNLNAFHFEGKFRCDHPQRSHHFGKPPGTDQEQRLCPLCISHGQKHPRQTADVIRMEMSKADNINRIGTPAFFPHGDLGSLSAVDQNTFSIISHHQGSQPSVR